MKEDTTDNKENNFSESFSVYENSNVKNYYENQEIENNLSINNDEAEKNITSTINDEKSSSKTIVVNKNLERTKNLAFSALFTALIAIGAFIKIPIPYVPITMQFLFTNLAGVLLLKKYGSISVFTYLLIGLIGIPIFTQGGGISYVFQPTFGYLVGFIFGTFTCGLIIEKSKNKNFKTYTIAGLCNIAVVYAMGILYFCLIKTLYLNAPPTASTIFLSLFLFVIPGDLISVFVSSIIALRLKPILKLNL